MAKPRCPVCWVALILNPDGSAWVHPDTLPEYYERYDKTRSPASEYPQHYEIFNLNWTSTDELLDLIDEARERIRHESIRKLSRRWKTSRR